MEVIEYGVATGLTELNARQLGGWKYVTHLSSDKVPWGYVERFLVSIIREVA